MDINNLLTILLFIISGVGVLIFFVINRLFTSVSELTNTVYKLELKIEKHCV